MEHPMRSIFAILVIFIILVGAATGYDNKKAKKTVGEKPGDIIDIQIATSVNARMVWVPPGESWLLGGKFKVGSQKFKVESGYWFSQYETTQLQWQAVMRENPSKFKGPRNPVEQVTHHDVSQYIDRLNHNSKTSGFKFRLPTRNEWEYAARGGPISKEDSKYCFYFAKSKTNLAPAFTNDMSFMQANFNGKSPAGLGKPGQASLSTVPVGRYVPNTLGIYDLHGNVREWTSTKTSNHYFVVGGSWEDLGDWCALDAYGLNMLANDPERKSNATGFRVIAEPVGEKAE
jgi:formylglycine-generating enzyme required for sulfatase activity